LWFIMNLFRLFFWVRFFMCMSVTPAVPYLFLGLQDVQWTVRNSRGARKLQDVQWAVRNNRGARKLTWTPHVKRKKKDWAVRNSRGARKLTWTPHVKRKKKDWTFWNLIKNIYVVELTWRLLRSFDKKKKKN
jgi:hypothetical protein